VTKDIDQQETRGGILRRQFARFLQVGILNTIGTYLLYLALNLILPYAVSYSITFVVGVLVSAWLNARYSFTTRLTGKSLVRFVVIYIISYALSLQLLVYFVEVTGIHPNLAPLLVLTVFTPINFLSSRLALTGQWRRQG
jgi:putative flippase GtrA